MPEIFVHKDLNELSSHAAELFIEIAKRSIHSRGRFAVALSGGSTPKSLYALLVADFAAAIDWNKVLFFFGDERNVRPNANESNYKMANETVFTPLNIADKNVNRWRTEIENPDAVAADYAGRVRKTFDQEPRFDLILLGLGSDVHTASLFPHTAALTELKLPAVANWVPKLNSFRFTLTFPLINEAENIVFLVTGEDKAAAVKHVFEGKYYPNEYPAQSVNPNEGRLYWLLDKMAAGRLEKFDSEPVSKDICLSAED
ncbi:MAG: 6-phosphogluconolactonase [Acidobacteria bacterium]|nr:6-phosphogluconolactonase [Acidobacteriota bacterium]